jgi:hypothetical protein
VYFESALCANIYRTYKKCFPSCQKTSADVGWGVKHVVDGCGLCFSPPVSLGAFSLLKKKRTPTARARAFWVCVVYYALVVRACLV